MAKITRGETEINLELSLQEAITLHTVLRYVSGHGFIRDNIRNILDALDYGGIDYYRDAKAAKGSDDLRFRDEK